MAADTHLRKGFSFAKREEGGVHRGQLLLHSHKEINRVRMDSFQKGVGVKVLQVTGCILGLGLASPIYVFCQNVIENWLGFVLTLGLCQGLKHLTSRSLSCCSPCNTGLRAVIISKRLEE